MSWRWTGGVEDPGESLVEIRLRAIVEGMHEFGWSQRSGNCQLGAGLSYR